MKSIYLLFPTLVAVVFLGFLVPQARANDVNNISIQNISVQPDAVKVGDTFTVTATLVNNSTVPIVLEGGTCVPLIEHVPFFKIMFDDHIKIKAKNLTCAGVGLYKILDPGKIIIGTSPDSTATYIATESGTANVTITFQYHVKNQDPTQPNIEQTISKSFQFLIHDINETYAQKSPAYFASLSPLKQFKSGIAAKDVQCKVGLQFIVKNENGQPACVSPHTMDKLIELGWGISFLESISNNEKNGILSGTISSYVYGGPLGGVTNRSANYEVSVYAPDGITMIGKTFSDDDAHYSLQLPAGKYIVYTYNEIKQKYVVSVFAGQNSIFNIISSIHVP